MAAPVGRYMRRGNTKFYYVPTIANKSAPTVVEITAGTDLSPQVAEVAGFEFANSPISSPDFANAFTPQVPGEDTASESSFTFYEIGGTDAIYTAQAKGATAYVAIFAKGLAGALPATADKCEIWPITIGSKARQYTADNEAAKYRVVYNVTAAPTVDVALV
jgi:hypothetical protein